MTVHLVNLTNPMMMKGPVREIIPLSSQNVQIKIPAGRKVERPAPSRQRKQMQTFRGRAAIDMKSLASAYTK